jgi:hypothetical protein
MYGHAVLAQLRLTAGKLVLFCFVFIEFAGKPALI